jgi:hypothetical protein
MDTTPPSSGDRITGGHRVAFFDMVRVISREEDNANALASAEPWEPDAG